MGVRTRASSPGGTLIQSGLLVNRPAFGIANRYYWATDIYVLFRDTGAAWEVVAERPWTRELYTIGQVGSATASVISANQVFYSPIQIPFTCTLDGLIVYHGGVAGGNFYVALYDSVNGQPVNRLAVSASTLCSGVTRAQYVPFTVAVRLTPGLYYLALESDNSLDGYVYGPSSQWMDPNDDTHIRWWYENLGAYLIPPAVATPTQHADSSRSYMMGAHVLSIP